MMQYLSPVAFLSFSAGVIAFLFSRRTGAAAWILAAVVMLASLAVLLPGQSELAPLVFSIFANFVIPSMVLGSLLGDWLRRKRA